MMPFHSWLPDAHSEAPAPISALLSGLVITVGPFGFARTVAFSRRTTPRSWSSSPSSGVPRSSLGILLAIAQDDLKRLLAYSTISQVGYVFAGIGLGTYLGIYGGLFHAVTHLLAKALLFFCAGAIIYRLGIRRISDLGGLSRKMPLTAALLLRRVPVDRRPPVLRRFPEQVHGRPRPRAVAPLVGARARGARGNADPRGAVWAAHRVFWGEESPRVAALAAGSSPGDAASPCWCRWSPWPPRRAARRLPQGPYPVLDSSVRSILALVGPRERHAAEGKGRAVSELGLRLGASHVS